MKTQKILMILLLTLFSINGFAQRNIEVDYGVSDPNLNIFEGIRNNETQYVNVGHWDPNFAEQSRCFIMVTDKDGFPNIDFFANPVLYKYSIINPTTSNPYSIQEVKSVKALSNNLVVSAGRIQDEFGYDGIHIETFNTLNYNFVNKMVHRLNNINYKINPTKLYVLNNEIYLTGHLNTNLCTGLPTYQCKKLFLIKFDINLNITYSKVYSYSYTPAYSDEIYLPKDIIVKKVSGINYVYIVGDLLNISSLGLSITPTLNHDFGFIIRIDDATQQIDNFKVVVNNITFPVAVYEGTSLDLIKDIGNEIFLGGRSEYLLSLDVNMVNKISTSVGLISNHTWKNTSLTGGREEVKDIVFEGNDQYFLVNQYPNTISNIVTHCVHKFSNNITTPVKIYNANRSFENYGVNLFKDQRRV